MSLMLQTTGMAELLCRLALSVQVPEELGPSLALTLLCMLEVRLPLHLLCSMHDKPLLVLSILMLHPCMAQV
jgi:hypothetical protein